MGNRVLFVKLSDNLRLREKKLISPGLNNQSNTAMKTLITRTMLPL